MVFMANQSSVTHQKTFSRRPKESNTAIESSKSFVDKRNKLGFCFSGYDESLLLKKKKKDSTRILGSDATDVNQDHKRRCLEKLVVRREQMTQQNVEDFNCALEVEVIDDTALIEATAAVTGFKNHYPKETDPGFGKNSGKTGGLKDSKMENGNGGKKKRNKGFKKQGNRCLMKCVNEKELKAQVVEDKNTSEKKIPEGKGQKGCRKMSAKVKYVYQKKDTKNPKSKATGVEGHQKVEDQNVVEKIVSEAIEETDASMKVSVGDENESTILTETETVNEKDDGVKLSPLIDVVFHTEREDQNASASTDVGLEKIAYTRAEMEALRFVDEPGQTAKWTEVLNGFASSVAGEYNGLVFDVKNGPPRYRRVVNFGYTRHANPVLSMPPVLPLCSLSNQRKSDHARVSVNSS